MIWCHMIKMMTSLQLLFSVKDYSSQQNPAHTMPKKFVTGKSGHTQMVAARFTKENK